MASKLTVYDEMRPLFERLFTIDEDVEDVLTRCGMIAEREREAGAAECHKMVQRARKECGRAFEDNEKMKDALTDAMAEIEMLKKQLAEKKTAAPRASKAHGGAGKPVTHCEVPDDLAVKGAPRLGFASTTLAKAAKKQVDEVGQHLADGEKVFRKSKDSWVDEAIVFNFKTHLEFRTALGVFHNASHWSNACLAAMRVRNGLTDKSTPSENGFIKCFVVRDGEEVLLRKLVETDEAAAAREKVAAARRELASVKKTGVAVAEKTKAAPPPSADSDSESSGSEAESD
jgi:hypothetical protein